MPDHDLTALADLADVSAQGLLTRRQPGEFSESRLLDGLRFVAGRPRRANRVLPASLVAVVEPAES